MSTYPFSIITPAGKVFEDEVEFVSAPGVEGSFGILSGHAPFVTTLRKGILKLTQNTQQRFFVIEEGILEVNPNRDVLLLTNRAVESRDESAARAELKKIKKS